MKPKSYFKGILVILGIVLVAAALVAGASKATFTSTEKAAYADERTVNFVRPGLVMKVTKAEIAADNTIRAWIKLTDPQGLPLDRLGIDTPGVITLSFLVAYIPANATQYVSYITRQRTSGANTATQATGENTGTWQKVAEGEYLYTFAAKAPSTIDRTLTHTIGIYGSRNLTEFDLGTNRGDAWLDFVPNGSAVTKVRDVVRTASCNKCHDQLAFHGGNRRSVLICNMCHTPQSTDPASGNTIDMKVMVHKIHMGSSLPSVVAKGRYFIGNADYSTIVNPSPVMDCGACHEAQSKTGATQANNHLTQPSRAACGSCHDNINWTTGENHRAGPATNDDRCSNCHRATSESDFDASVSGAHTVPQRSNLLKGLQTDIVAADNIVPGGKAVITFTIKNNAGEPVPPASLGTMRLYMGGPNVDVTSYVREDAKAATDLGNGRYRYTFTAPIPDTMRGSMQFGIEAYRTVTLLEGTAKQRSVREAAVFKVIPVSADGSPTQARRAVVSTAKCQACHSQFGFHGGNRNTVESCTFCHTPSLYAEGESWNFPTFIHRFHEEARYPGVLSNCNQCHINNSQFLPLPDSRLPTVTGQAPTTTMPPMSNACLSCHNTDTAKSHAAANTNQYGESCAVCHGPNSSYSVAKVHAQ
ncbi:MAG: OmcA/MtrC family decaheme c-type cytochrome [Acidobacteria bacterium]|nr:OmcA/MtrC family decaheme c-type cytochrome [Acidobacteriota bacterium]